MKKSTLLATGMFMLTVISSSVIALSCNNKPGNSTEDTAKIATEQNDTKFENKKQENDAQFLVDATAASLQEIKLGSLAMERSNSKEVRDLGKMMVEAHTKALKEARDLAKTKQVTVPDSITSDTYTVYTDLSSKSGNDFNKAYCEKLIEAHKDAIGKFEKETSDSRDQDIKEWSAGMLPELRKHVDHVYTCQKKLGIQ
ncbi:MAG TPA: DUF4142 domain-containing protein [Chitinophagales bacterium]|nr:DUF4142 domain-containing protein [Chitinophagales bacterium]